MFTRNYQKHLNQLSKLNKKTKETIDENQNQMLEQLQKNQKAITSGLDDLLMIQQLPRAADEAAKTNYQITN